MKKVVRFWFPGLRYCIFLQIRVDTKILEELAASIFWIEVKRARCGQYMREVMKI
jgi:hypothetical protein